MRLLWRSVVTSLNEDHNSFLYWYPKIVGRVATPKTVIVLTEGASTKWIDEGAPEPFVLKLKAAAKPLGYPVFMRTEQLSAKHLWEGTGKLGEQAKNLPLAPLPAKRPLK
jgi:hypothetical protein